MAVLYNGTSVAREEVVGSCVGNIVSVGDVVDGKACLDGVTIAVGNTWVGAFDVTLFGKAIAHPVSNANNKVLPTCDERKRMLYPFHWFFIC
jgi:hypothetical protein